MSDVLVFKGKHRSNLIAKTEKARLRYKIDFKLSDLNQMDDGSLYINRNNDIVEELINDFKLGGLDVEIR